MREKLKNLFLENFQKTLNRYLSLDPESAKRLASLQNKTVLIEMSAVNQKLFLYFSTQGVTLLTDETGVADTVIRGTPLRLLQLSLSPATRQKFFADDVSITGNVEVGHQVIRLFDEMEIDWEEQLSHVVGDAAAYRVGSAAKRIKSWFEDAKTSIMQDVNDYLHEEKRVLPAKEALEDFYKDIDVLRMDADRLEARIKKIEERIAARGTGDH